MDRYYPIRDITMNYTEIIEVERIGNPTVVFPSRQRHYIENGDRLTFRGDSHSDMMERGETYRFVGKTKKEPTDSVWVEHEETGERVQLYNEDFRYYLLGNCFEIHDV